MAILSTVGASRKRLQIKFTVSIENSIENIIFYRKYYFKCGSVYRNI